MPMFSLVERDGEDTLHRSPAFTECQVPADATKVRLSLVAARELVVGGSAHACEFCEPLGLASGDPSGQ